MPVVLAIDAGTTGVRTRAVFTDGRPSVASYREFTQHFPQPGLGRARRHRDLGGGAGHAARRAAARLDEPVAAIGITNQRETVVAWDRTTGPPAAPAPSSGRTGARRAGATSSPPPATSRSSGSAPGWCSIPYFSGTKVGVAADPGGRRRRGVPAGPDLALGTIDTWLLWNLTGGEVLATDPSNASRTMLFDIGALAWSDELCDAARRAHRARCPRCGRRAAASA